MTRPSVWMAGLTPRCPQCGKDEVFAGYLRFRGQCRARGADFKAADAGDGPAVFVILVVGAIAAPLLIIPRFAAAPPDWLALAVTMAAAAGLCLAPFKATLFALQWKHRAREATREDIA